MVEGSDRFGGKPDGAMVFLLAALESWLQVDAKGDVGELEERLRMRE